MKIAIPMINDVPQNYLNAVLEFGHEPVKVDAAVDSQDYDGLVLPGGCDIVPQYYGEEDTGCWGTNEELDKLQFAVLDKVVKAGKPVLGICRGHQVVNVYFGGSMIQHIPGFARHAHDEDSSEDKAHPTRMTPGSLVYRLYGPEVITNSSHHQAAKNVPDCLEITAMFDDGYVEGLAHKTLPVFSVQWHPERMFLSYYKPERADGALIWKEFFRICEEKKG